MNPKELKPSLRQRKLQRLNNLIVLIIFGIPILGIGFWGVTIYIWLPLLILWLVLFILADLYIVAAYKNIRYRLDSEAVLLNIGVFWKRHTMVPYSKITNLDITQGPLERMFGLSKIHIQTAGLSGANNPQAELMMIGITDPELLKSQIMSRSSKLAAKSANLDDEATLSSDVLQAILDELKLIRKNM